MSNKAPLEKVIKRKLYRRGNQYSAIDITVCKSLLDVAKGKHMFSKRHGMIVPVPRKPSSDKGHIK